MDAALDMIVVYKACTVSTIKENIFYIYEVLFSVCLFACFSNHNSETPRPICLKYYGTR